MTSNSTLPTPTGFHHPAQGCRVSGCLGTAIKKRSNPEAVEAIPNTAFIEPDGAALQQMAKLIF